jgi:hypothetical protein
MNKAGGIDVGLREGVGCLGRFSVGEKRGPAIQAELASRRRMEDV